MTEIIRQWREQADGTLRLTDIGWICAPGISGYGECTIDAPFPMIRRDWLIAFGDLVGSACKVDQSVADPRERIHLGSQPCAVLCMFSWAIRCARMVKSEQTRLRIARLELPTPSEMRGTAAKSFCEQIVEVVEQRCIWLRRHFVTHTKASLDLPIEEQLSHESKQICEQFRLVSQQWRFEPLDAAQWMRLIELELNKCDWLKEQQLGVADNDQNKVFTESLGLRLNGDNRTVQRDGDNYSHLEPIRLSAAQWALLQQLLLCGKNGVTRKQLAAEFKISEPAVSQRKNDLKNKLLSIDITIPGDDFRLESLC